MIIHNPDFKALDIYAEQIQNMWGDANRSDNAYVCVELYRMGRCELLIHDKSGFVDGIIAYVLVSESESDSGEPHIVITGAAGTSNGGAGKCMLYLQKLAQKQSLEIFVYVSYGAHGFYSRYGFTPDIDDNDLMTWQHDS